MPELEAEPNVLPKSLFPLRTGVALALATLGLRFLAPTLAPGFEGFRVAMLGGLLGSVAIVIWWLVAHRSRSGYRFTALVAVIAGMAVTWQLNHGSMRLMWLVSFAIPLGACALVAWAVLERQLSAPRRWAMVVALFAVSLPWVLWRTDGMTGGHQAQLVWRWAATADDLLSAREADFESPSRSPDQASDVVGVSWPGFRGIGGASTVADSTLGTEWSSRPPVEVWRRPIGPGWSSFAVSDGRLFTQEQRADHEAVSAYDLATGELLWRHQDAARFFDPMAGSGPRATPTVDGGSVITLGSTGRLNALRADGGTLLWSRDVIADAEVSTPTWGFASSPIVVDDLVLVSAGSRLAAFDLATGEPRWLGPPARETYSSPRRVTLDGVAQIAVVDGDGAKGFEPSSGRLLWHHPWRGRPLVQPAPVDRKDLLIAAGEGFGVRRLAIRRTGAGWSADELWTSDHLKPNFNDFVVHEGFAYGFDGRFLACLDLAAGERRWKGGRYGHGQLLLLAEQQALVVITETGELVLVDASPSAHIERARLPALEGKTWNHPVLVGDLLVVRNGHEMAAFRLPTVE